MTAIRNAVFWDVTPCGTCKKRRFGGTYKTTRRTIPEDGILHGHRRENFKSYMKALSHFPFAVGFNGDNY
jgi:hypothetical protein